MSCFVKRLHETSKPRSHRRGSEPFKTSGYHLGNGFRDIHPSLPFRQRQRRKLLPFSQEQVKGCKRIRGCGQSAPAQEQPCCCENLPHLMRPSFTHVDFPMPASHVYSWERTQSQFRKRFSSGISRSSSRMLIGPGW